MTIGTATLTGCVLHAAPAVHKMAPVS